MSGARMKLVAVALQAALLSVAASGALALERPTPGKACEPMTKNALSVWFRPAAAAFEQRQPLTFDVTLKNVSAKAIVLAGVGLGRLKPPGCSFIITDVKTGAVKRVREGQNPMIMAPVRFGLLTIQPGKSLAVPYSLNRWAWYFSGRPIRRTYLGPAMLPPGRYQVAMHLELGRGPTPSVKRWTGKIITKATQFRITPAKTPQPGVTLDGRGVGAWTTLFAGKRWYKAQRGKEQIFRGVLRAVPNAGGLTMLMRTSHYRLGKRTIYTGARKHPALDKLVGRFVEIRGKPVDMRLEGQALRELWPGAIRPFLPKVPPPNQGGVPGKIKRVPGDVGGRAGG